MSIDFSVVIKLRLKKPEGLLFGPDLGKSVKDFTEASKVSKVALKQQIPHHSYNSQERSDHERLFPFLGRGTGWVEKQRGNFRSVPQNVKHSTSLADKK